MCGRYASFMSVRDVQLAFDIDSVGTELERYAPSWNVAPGQDVPIVVDTLREDGPHPSKSAPGTELGATTNNTGTTAQVHRELHLARWGLVVPWAKTLESAHPLINARMETLAVKPSFKEAISRRRCIVPANGYFEWQRVRKQRLPYYISNGAPLAFAGLYGWWRTPDQSWLLTTTIVTGPAQPPLNAIHDRNPIVLEPHEWTRWLDPEQTNGSLAAEMLQRANRPLSAYRVSHTVGSPRNNTPDNIQPIAPADDKGTGEPQVNRV